MQTEHGGEADAREGRNKARQDNAGFARPERRERKRVCLGSLLFVEAPAAAQSTSNITTIPASLRPSYRHPPHDYRDYGDDSNHYSPNLLPWHDLHAEMLALSHPLIILPHRDSLASPVERALEGTIQAIPPLKHPLPPTGWPLARHVCSCWPWRHARAETKCPSPG